MPEPSPHDEDSLSVAEGSSPGPTGSGLLWPGWFDTPLGLLLIYLLAAGLWLMLAERLMWALSDAPAWRAAAPSVKAWGFVVATAGLFWRLLRQGRVGGALHGASGLPSDSWRTLWRPLLPWWVVIGLGTALAMTVTLMQLRKTEEARLHAIASLAANQLSQWIAERQGDLLFLQGSAHWAGLNAQALQGQPAAAQQLRERLSAYIGAKGYDGAATLTPTGEVVVSVGLGANSGWQTTDLRLALDRLRVDASWPSLVGPALDPQGHAWLDLLTAWGGAAESGRSLLLLRVDPEQRLRPLLANWPVPTRSGELLLLRPKDGQVLLLARTGAAGAAVSVADATASPFLRELVREQADTGALVEGQDEADHSVMGVVKRVPGTDWMVVAKLDGREFLSNASVDLIWNALTGMLAVGFTLGLALQRRQRQMLQSSVRRQQRQARQIEALRLLKVMTDSLDDAVMARDLDGRYLLFNRAAERITGQLAEGVLGQQAPVLFNVGQSQALAALREQALRQARVVTAELVLDTAQGRRHVQAIEGPLRDDPGQMIGTYGVLRDITEQRQWLDSMSSHRQDLEDEVERRTSQLAEARERAESASRAKTAFLANMSHEIRTPMNAILGLVRLMRDDGPTSPQSARLGRIEEAAQHLMGILNDVLDLSKIEAGRLDLQHSDFLLGSLLDEVRAQVQPVADLKGLRLEVEASPAHGAWLRGDVNRLRQALLNYASNAVKFTEQGQVKLRATLSDVEPTADEGTAVTLRVEVEDTGIGLSAAQMQRLFQPFEQVDTSTTRRYGGTGLGLVITRRLAALMGGDTGVSSVLGRGSCFWMTARLTLGQALTLAPRLIAGSPAERLRQRRQAASVLLAEDHPTNQEVLGELLRAVGLRVTAVSTGEEAVSSVLQQRFDLVLMDLQMPVMDGLSAAREIRRHPELRQLPIVALTANAYEDDQRACAEAGMNAFIGKPVDPDRLYETVLSWLPNELALPVAGQGPAGDATVPPLAPELQRLSTLPGLDLRRGLALVAGQQALYLRVLRVFLDTHRQDPGQLQALCLQGDLDALQRHAHSLKGAASSIGAIGVAAAARDLETCLRTEQPPAARMQLLMDRLTDELLPLLDTLMAGLESRPEVTPALPPAADPGGHRDLLGELLGSLELSDLGASVLARERAQELREALGSVVADTVLRSIERYDYDGALIKLREALAGGHTL